MTNDLGVFTADDCALVLIDYQKEMFEVIRSETSADLVEMHVRLLARTAKAFDVPIVATTVGVAAGRLDQLERLFRGLDRHVAADDQRTLASEGEGGRAAHAAAGAGDDADLA